jgi:pimeloyl-ACP methyl ester carboxylesterase
MIGPGEKRSPVVAMNAPRPKKGYVDTPIGQVHFRALGDGPPVVLLHQTPWSGVQYQNAMPFIAAAGLQAIAIDTPGYGMSDNFSGPPSVSDYADVLPYVFDGLALPQAAVAAHHTGASIAASFAARHPQRVSRLVLHGVPLYTAEERAERLARPHFDQTPQPDGSHFTRRWEIARKLSAKATLEAIHTSVVQFFWAGPNEWYGHHAAFSYDIAPDLRALKMPTMILSNTGDSLHPVVARVKDMRPDFSYAEMPGGTYHVVFDEAEAWSKIVAGFVKGGR